MFKSIRSIYQVVIGIALLISLYVLVDTKEFYLSVIVFLSILSFSVLLLTIYQSLKVRKLKSSELAEIDQMTGEQFEEYLYYLFKDKGYKAKMTSSTGDFGADLVLNDLQSGEKIVVQAKRYKGNVGVGAVQEVVGSIGYYNADRGWVITNSHFTKSAIELARSNGVRVINRNNLRHIMANVK